MFLFCFALFAIACGQNQAEAQQSSTDITAKPAAPKAKTVALPSARLPKGYPLGPFPIKTEFPYNIDLKTADGKVINSSKVFKQNGKPTILMFWLTTCYPCRMELNAIKKKFPQWQEAADFNMYAISTDFSKNYGNFCKRVEESGWKWEAYNDVNRQFRNVMPGGLNGLPQVFVFDKNGDIVYHKRKYRPGDEDTLFEKVKSLK